MGLGEAIGACQVFFFIAVESHGRLSGLLCLSFSLLFGTTPFRRAHAWQRRLAPRRRLRSFHFIRGGNYYHYFSFQNFPPHAHDISELPLNDRASLRHYHAFPSPLSMPLLPATGATPDLECHMSATAVRRLSVSHQSERAPHCQHLDGDERERERGEWPQGRFLVVFFRGAWPLKEEPSAERLAAPCHKQRFCVPSGMSSQCYREGECRPAIECLSSRFFQGGRGEGGGAHTTPSHQVTGCQFLPPNEPHWPREFAFSVFSTEGPPSSSLL